MGTTEFQFRLLFSPETDVNSKSQGNALPSYQSVSLNAKGDLLRYSAAPRTLRNPVIGPWNL